MVDRKEESFGDVFENVLQALNTSDYTADEMVNALACATATLALYSEDPNEYIDVVTDRMKKFVEAKTGATA